MKKINYIKTTLLSLTAMALLSSCLKDNRYIDFAASKPLIEFPAAAYGGEFQVAGVEAANTPTAFPIILNIASPNTLSTPVTVTVSINPAALTAYNTANGTSYLALPAADYTVASNTVTIPAKTRQANYVVNINTAAVGTNPNYVLPVTITAVSGGLIIDQYNTMLYNITVKNAYDDTYTESGYKFHPSVGASHALSGNIAITTVTAVTSNTAVGDLGGSNYTFNFDTNGNTVSNWVAQGSTPAAPASGFFTADNPGGVSYTTTGAAGAGIQPGTAPYVQTTYNNSYDATNKVFYFHYGYGSGSSSQNGWTRNFYVKMVAQ